VNVERTVLIILDLVGGELDVFLPPSRSFLLIPAPVIDPTADAGNFFTLLFVVVCPRFSPGKIIVALLSSCAEFVRADLLPPPPVSLFPLPYPPLPQDERALFPTPRRGCCVEDLLFSPALPRPWRIGVDESPFFSQASCLGALRTATFRGNGLFPPFFFLRESLLWWMWFCVPFFSQ